MSKVRSWLITLLLNQDCAFDSMRGEEIGRRKIRGKRDRSIVKSILCHFPSIATSISVEQESWRRIEWQMQLSKLFRAFSQRAEDRHHINGGHLWAGERIEERAERQWHGIVKWNLAIASRRERNSHQHSFRTRQDNN